MPSRRRMFVMGGIGALVLALVFLADAFVGRAATIASGSLSNNHALFSKDCATCHTAFTGTTDEKCLSCHQKSGRSNMFTLERHYEYHSGMTDRAALGHDEPSCGSCHREHEGRTTPLTQVASAQCQNCHDVGAFGKKHPEFEFAAKQIPDPANLKFPHAKHVREVMSEFDLADAEEACVRCHEAQPDGRSFKPISYAQSCDGCHLGSSSQTATVPVRGGGGPGAWTLAQIRASGGPNSGFAFHWNPNEFTQEGGISKRPVYHADPWILFNLQKLRREMFPATELADLLRTSPETSPREARAIHREAINTLRSQLDALRSNPSPDVQQEISAMTAMLAQVEERLEQPYAPFDETRFGVSAADLAPGINKAAYEEVVNGLTEPCQECHIVENATIRRVQKDQRGLVRAEFDHRAHVIHARCLDCHQAIPIREALAADDDLPAAKDRAEIVNIPGIATCRNCHSARAASVQCTSCHIFHPDKSHRSNLTR